MYVEWHDRCHIIVVELVHHRVHALASYSTTLWMPSTAKEVLTKSLSLSLSISMSVYGGTLTLEDKSNFVLWSPQDHLCGLPLWGGTGNPQYIEITRHNTSLKQWVCRQSSPASHVMKLRNIYPCPLPLFPRSSFLTVFLIDLILTPVAQLFVCLLIINLPTTETQYTLSPFQKKKKEDQNIH